MNLVLITTLLRRHDPPSAAAQVAAGRRKGESLSRVSAVQPVCGSCSRSRCSRRCATRPTGRRSRSGRAPSRAASCSRWCAGSRPACARPASARAAGVGMVLSLSPEAYAAHLAAHALGCRVAAARPGWSPPSSPTRWTRVGSTRWSPTRRLDAARVLPLDDLLARPDPVAGRPAAGPAGRRRPAHVHQRQHRPAQGLRAHVPGDQPGLPAGRLAAGPGPAADRISSGA